MATGYQDQADELRHIFLCLKGLAVTWNNENENGNLVGKLRENKVFKNAERENNSNVENFGRKNSINWNHTDSILNLNQKYSDSINVDLNNTNLNQPIPADLASIGSIHDSDNICAIEKILASPVHSPIHAS